MAEGERAWVDTPTQNAWILGEQVPGVRFRMCQPVEVVTGPDRGARGISISLYALVPEPEFHLETDDGGDIVVLQSQLQASDT
jgi:hypothetical protein